MRLNPWAVWLMVAGILAPYLVGLVCIARRRLKARKPPLPDVILPLGWYVWHWDEYLHMAYRWEWTGRRWRRTDAVPIKPVDIPELEEHK